MRVLVCGGRNYDGDAPWNHVMSVLGAIHDKTPVAAVIEGGASGADSLARAWANMHGIKCVTVSADWHSYGKSAGPIRNERMLTVFKPDLVVAFPGGRGTADMVRQAMDAGLEVMHAVSETPAHD